MDQQPIAVYMDQRAKIHYDLWNERGGNGFDAPPDFDPVEFKAELDRRIREAGL